MIEIDMDMPDACKNCRFYIIDNDNVFSFCSAAPDWIVMTDTTFTIDNIQGRQEWCPLRKVTC